MDLALAAFVENTQRLIQFSAPLKQGSDCVIVRRCIKQLNQCYGLKEVI